MIRCSMDYFWKRRNVYKYMHFLHQSTAISMWWCCPRLLLGWSKWLLAFPMVQVTTNTPLAQTNFSPCCPLNNRRRTPQSFFKINHLSSLFCLSLAHLCLLILLLLMMSGNVYFNPSFPCSVCAGIVTWRGRSVQCCTCSKWVHLKCSLLLFSKFRTVGSSHSWSCPSCRISAYSGDNAVTSSSSLYISIRRPSANAELPSHPRFQTYYLPSAHFVSSPSASLPPPASSSC